MSLITYECQKAEHGHEIRQFNEAAQSLYDYFDGRDENAVFIGNVNIGDANLDGLIVKNDAIIIVEFKDYSGVLEARQNGNWTCNGKPIKGGNGGKTVFEQLKKNRGILRKVIGEQSYFTEAQRHDIKGLVVLTKLEGYSDDFDRSNKAWVFVSDVANMGNIMHDIESANFKDYRTGREVDSSISDNDIWNFLRKFKIEERCLVTDFSDTTIMPSDLFHKDSPHNGKYSSTASQLSSVKKQNEQLQQQISELLAKIETLRNNHQKDLNDRDLRINQQKAELLKIESEKLESEKETAKAEIEVGKLKNELEKIQQAQAAIKTSREEDKDSLPVASHVKENEDNDSNENRRVVKPVTKKRRFGLKERVLKEFHVGEDSLDSEQIGLIDRNLEHSMIVSGCAGSGKSVIAMYKARQIIEEGGDVILIAYTKSLERYMQQGSTKAYTGRHFYYHWQWVNAGKPSADYIIVDEIQDFSRAEINDFIKAARKCYFFFGDSAQSIYGGIKETLSIKELSEFTGIKISYLNNNYRLPKPVAKITQGYVGVDANPYAESIYMSKENALPHFVAMGSDEEQFGSIVNLIQKKSLKSVGILVPSNDNVLQLMNYFNKKNFLCEYKYNSDENDKYNKVTLDFNTQLPKLMSYHSAKGLQFEAVILPLFKGASSKEDLKALYVAMTRTYRFLYLFYSGDEIPAPLNKVPKRLYEDTLK